MSDISNGTREVERVKSYYESFVFPGMSAHQSVFAVPGVFWDKRFNNKTTTFVRHQAQNEQRIVAKLQAYVDWAKVEPRLAGLMPWHYNDRCSKSMASSFAKLCGGARTLPKVVTELRRIGASLPKKLKGDDERAGPTGAAVMDGVRVLYNNDGENLWAVTSTYHAGGTAINGTTIRGSVDDVAGRAPGWYSGAAADVNLICPFHNVPWWNSKLEPPEAHRDWFDKTFGFPWGDGGTVASTKDVALVPCTLLAFAPYQRSNVENCILLEWPFCRILDHLYVLLSSLLAQTEMSVARGLKDQLCNPR